MNAVTDKDLVTPVAITTQFEKPYFMDGVATGSYTYARQQPMSDVLAQIQAVLHTIHDADGCTAAQSAEWVSPAHGLDLFPKGEAFAAMRRGNSEGYLVQIFAYDRISGVLQQAVTIKFLSSLDFAYRVTRVVNEALWEGGFKVVLDPQPAI